MVNLLDILGYHPSDMTRKALRNIFKDYDEIYKNEDDSYENISVLLLDMTRVFHSDAVEEMTDLALELFDRKNARVVFQEEFNMHSAGFKELYCKLTDKDRKDLEHQFRCYTGGLQKNQPNNMYSIAVGGVPGGRWGGEHPYHTILLIGFQIPHLGAKIGGVYRSDIMVNGKDNEKYLLAKYIRKKDKKIEVVVETNDPEFKTP